METGFPLPACAGTGFAGMTNLRRRIIIAAPHQVRDELQPKSRKNKHFWTPAFAGVTALMTFYETVNVE